MKSTPLGQVLSFPLRSIIIPNRKTLTKIQRPAHSLCNCYATMSAHTDPTKPTSQNDLQTTQNYPVPLSPPLPPISKDIELSRAMSASSKSSLYSISRRDFIYEDEWLIAVNKPQGVYCESVFDSVRNVLCDSTEPGRLGEAYILNLLPFF